MKKYITALALTTLVSSTTVEAQPEPGDVPGEEPAEAPAATPTSNPISAAEPAPTPPQPLTPTAPPKAVPRLRLELELFTSARWIHRTGPDFTELRLDRGEAGVDIGLASRASAGLQVEAVRSAGEGGALGIDGDALVLRIKRAQIAGETDAGPVHLDGAIGVVADPWISLLDNGYTLRPLSANASERLLGWSTSDLAIRGRGTIGPASLAVSVGNGEGLRYPERNSGKTTTAVLEILALDRSDARLTIAGMVRDGSVGPALVREQRVGGMVGFASPWVRGGGEVVNAWGVGDRADVVATVIGGWVEGRLVDHLFLGVRGATIGYTGGRSSTVGGAIAVEAQRQKSDRLRLWLAIDHTPASGAGAPLPGSDTGTATTFMLIASATAPFLVE